MQRFFLFIGKGLGYSRRFAERAHAPGWAVKHLVGAVARAAGAGLGARLLVAVGVVPQGELAKGVAADHTVTRLV
jgi:hypothetical protein